MKEAGFKTGSERMGELRMSRLESDESAEDGDIRGFRAQRFYLKKSKFVRKRVFVFCKFYFVILPTLSGNCILIFTLLESSLRVLSNCVFLKLLI